MKDRTTLTKSLHTITACENVARFLVDTFPKFKGTKAINLAATALGILGHELTDYGKDDETVARCIRACVGVLAVAQAKKERA